MAEVLLISEKTLKSESYLNDNVGSEMILPAIQTAQDIKLQPLLGCNLYNTLKQMVLAEEVPEPYLTLLKTYIKPFLIYAVMSDIQVPLAFKTRANGGAVQANTEYTYNSDRKDTEMIANYYEDKMNFYGFRLTDYLKQNSSNFPEYRINDCGCNSDLRQGFNSGIFLG